MPRAPTFDDVWRMFQENAAQMRDTDRRFKETDRQMQETARQMKETDLKIQETDRIVKEVSKKIGALGSRWGEFVEGLVAPACETIFAERGIPIHKVSRRVKAKLSGGRHMEIDVLVVNTDAVALVEVKSVLTVEAVREHLARLSEFKDFFLEYADKRVFGAVAGIVIEEDADRFAMNKGLFVIVQSGDTLRIANEPEFQPRAW
ncbi:MAG: DUF3782 domain-containing protein [Nitrospirae bacterium]|nr:DUF3782 domain-containing protein [Magnetococcales bacterium]HAT49259.1 DUF3782 domain-containing protein [Alphaproteobacteria bacterium]